MNGVACTRKRQRDMELWRRGLIVLQNLMGEAFDVIDQGYYSNG